MNKIYIGECEHLQPNCCILDDECLKRHFHIMNPRTNSTECLVFCNDYLKLKSQQKADNFSWKENVIEVIQKEIYNHIKIEKKYRPSTYSLSDHYFSYYVCERPYTYVSVSFKEIIEWYFENPTRELLELIFEQIKSFLDRLYYKKYKSRYLELIRLCNKLTDRYGYPVEEKQSILLELITKTFELTIKNQ